jgi:hypothetical protein
MAEHSINLDNPIQFHDTSILVRKSRHMIHIIKEMVETELYPDVNSKNGLSMSRSWMPLI